MLSCVLFVLSLRAGLPEAVPTFHIDPGEASTAQVRLFSTAIPELYIVLNARKFPSYDAFVRQNTGHAARIYVCGELVSDLALSQADATNELTYLIPPKKAFDLAQQLMKTSKEITANRH